MGSGNFEDEDGQLIVFFPTSRSLDAVFGRRTPEEVCPGGDCSRLRARHSDYCVVGNGLRTAGGLAMDARRNVYLAEFATVDRLVSNANAIAGGLFLVWMYYTAVVFLIGGEVAQTYDLVRRQREQRAILT